MNLFPPPINPDPQRVETEAQNQPLEPEKQAQQYGLEEQAQKLNLIIQTLINKYGPVHFEVIADLIDRERITIENLEKLRKAAIFKIHELCISGLFMELKGVDALLEKLGINAVGLSPSLLNEAIANLDYVGGVYIKSIDKAQLNVDIKGDKRDVLLTEQEKFELCRKIILDTGLYMGGRVPIPDDLVTTIVDTRHMLMALNERGNKTGFTTVTIQELLKEMRGQKESE